MTRRERHIRILDNMGERRVKWELEGLLVRNGLSLFSDEAIEVLATRCWRSLRDERRRNAENRKLFAARRQAV